LCLVGKADLKEELKKYLGQWGWKKSVDELLSYWFVNEGVPDEHMLKSVKSLRSKGVACYLGTNNEKYRTQYLFEDIGLKKYFDGTFSSAELGFMKPQQEFWASIYEYLGEPNKSEVLVWDDDEKNVTSAKSFGFRSELYSDVDSYEKRIKALVV